ncbi:MAG: hypothetical protein ABFS35_23925 [Bacteroidota bacterium]
MKLKATLIMATIIMIICFGTIAQSGAGETYDLNGEWDTVFDHGPFGVDKDIVKISQQGNTFVGVALIGSKYISKGEETIKGELINKMISQVYSHNHNQDTTGEGVWDEAQGVIIEEGNKILIQSYVMNLFVKKIIMIRKQ